MPLDRKRLARTKLAARQERIATIRSRVFTFTALLFVVLWMVICAQIVLGHDPALSAKARARREAAVIRARNLRRASRGSVIDLGSLRAPRVRRHRRPDPAAVQAALPQVAPEPAPPGAAAAAAPTPQPAPVAPAPPPPPPPPPTPVVTSQS
jgi:hypothetical protein